MTSDSFLCTVQWQRQRTQKCTWIWCWFHWSGTCPALPPFFFSFWRNSICGYESLREFTWQTTYDAPPVVATTTIKMISNSSIRKIENDFKCNARVTPCLGEWHVASNRCETNAFAIWTNGSGAELYYASSPKLNYNKLFYYDFRLHFTFQ